MDLEVSTQQNESLFGVAKVGGKRDKISDLKVLWLGNWQDEII